MNLQSDDLALFVRVVELGTLSAAAREREAPVSQVTRALARLEAACGVRLMHRSTHGLSLTDEGDALLAHARRLLETQAELTAELTGRISGPSGWVRVSASALLAQVLIAPSLPTLYARHGALRLDVAITDRIIDLAREGVDVAIRTGSPHNDLLVARQIGQLSRGLYAARSYVDRHGLPSTVEALDQHHLIANSAVPALNQWPMQGAGRTDTYVARPRTRADSTAAVLALAEAGVGIARLLDWVARPRGLVPVLPEFFGGTPVAIYAVMLRERQRLPKVRACVDHWVQWLSDVA